MSLNVFFDIRFNAFTLIMNHVSFRYVALTFITQGYTATI